MDSFTERDIEEGQWQIEVEDQIWNASDRTAIARMEQYLEKKGDSTMVQVEELESMLGPEDSKLDVRRIMEEARNKKGRAIFETFSSEGPSELILGGQQSAMGPAPQEAGYAEGGAKKNRTRS